MIVETLTVGPFAHRSAGGFKRADLEIYGINHLRPSYEAWVFFNDPEVDGENADPSRPSFAGTFAIFGHTDCWGSAGHCHTRTATRRFDRRRSDPLTRAFRRVMVTHALKKVSSEFEELTITIVARSREEWDRPEGARLLDCSGMQLALFG